MNSNTPHAALSVTAHGHCDLVVGSALAFLLIGWDVRVDCSEQEVDRVAKRLAQFKGSGRLHIESTSAVLHASPSTQSSAFVYCGIHTPDAARDLNPGTIAVELVGVTVADGDQSWSSCSMLLAYMRSGEGILTRQRGAEGLTGTPYLPAGSLLSSFFVGLHAVMLVAAVIDTPEPPRVVTLSAQECLLAPLHNAALYAQVERRDTARAIDPPPVGGRFEAKDGSVLVSAASGDHWEKLIGLLGNPGWGEGGWWRDAEARFSNRDLLNPAISAWCNARTKNEAFVTLQRAGIPAAYVAYQSDVLENQHLSSRGFIREDNNTYTFGRPYTATFSDRIVNADDGSQNGSSEFRLTNMPLSGIRICDLSWVWAGPYLTMHAAMLGASVVKVENRSRIDTHREVRPFVEGPAPVYERAAGHLLTNRNKLSVEIDFKTPSGMQVLKDLIASSDALVANFSPGVLERIGLGFDEVADLVGSRGFVYLSLSGFGETGPWRNYRSLGAHLAELSGLTTLTGVDGLPPISMGIPFGDPLGGTFGTAALLSYLRVSREREAPVFLDISQFEILAAGISDAILDGRRLGNIRGDDYPGTGVYRCSGSDAWVAVSVKDRVGCQALARYFGVESSESGLPTSERLEAELAGWAAEHACVDAEALLRGSGVDASQVLSVSELLTDQSLRAASYWVRGSTGEAEFMMQGAPWHFDNQRVGTNAPAPLIGQDTEDVLREILGYSESKIRNLTG